MHVDARIVGAEGNDLPDDQPGELLVRGPNVFNGYWRNPEATAAALQDGWFRTGDIARRDIEGFYYIEDRAKDVIISGGENIYPAELEQILAAEADLAGVRRRRPARSALGRSAGDRCRTSRRPDN